MQMSALNELLDCIRAFTPEQLKEFLNNPITLSILQPEEAFVSCLPAEFSSDQ